MHKYFQTLEKIILDFKEIKIRIMLNVVKLKRKVNGHWRKNRISGLLTKHYFLKINYIYLFMQVFY